MTMFLLGTFVLLSSIPALQCFDFENFDTEWNSRLQLPSRTFTEHEVRPNRHSPNVQIKSLTNKAIDGIERVEALKATIKNPLPTPGSRMENFNDNDRKYMREKLGARPVDRTTKIGDEAGHILGYALGGPVDRRNLFPQHSGTNRNVAELHLLIDWVAFEKTLRQYMSDNRDGKIEYKIWFDYPQSSAAASSATGAERYKINRPQRFAFYAKLYRDDRTAEYECEFNMSNDFSISQRKISTARTTRGRTAITTPRPATIQSPAQRYCTPIRF